MSYLELTSLAKNFNILSYHLHSSERKYGHGGN